MIEEILSEFHRVVCTDSHLTVCIGHAWPKHDVDMVRVDGRRHGKLVIPRAIDVVKFSINSESKNDLKLLEP